MHHDDRLGLINDAFVLTQQRLQSWPQTLNLSLFLQHDTAFTVWQVALPSLAQVYQYLKYQNSTAHRLYVQYMQQAMSGVASQLNLSATATPSLSDAILESVVGRYLVRFNVSGRVNVLRPIFTSLRSGQITAASISPNLIDMVLAVGVMDEGRLDDWQWVYETFYVAKMRARTNETVMDPLASLSMPAIIGILTSTRSAEALQRLLDNLLDPFYTAAGDIYTFLQLIAQNPRGLELLNAWLQQGDTFTQLQASIPAGAFGNFLRAFLSYNSQTQVIAELTTFFQRQTLADGVRESVNNGLLAAKANEDWLSVNYQPISDYLSSGVWRNSSVDLPSPPPPPPPAEANPWMDRRLPGTAQPSFYRVETMIDLDSSPPVFWGTVNITLRVTQPTDFLVVHRSDSLAISEVAMKGEDGLPIGIAGWVVLQRQPIPRSQLHPNSAATVHRHSVHRLLSHSHFQPTVRPVPGLLHQLHRAAGQPGHHSIRSDVCETGLPLLRRAVVQGSVRHLHPRVLPLSHSAVQHAGGQCYCIPCALRLGVDTI